MKDKFVFNTPQNMFFAAVALMSATQPTNDFDDRAECNADDADSAVNRAGALIEKLEIDQAKYGG